MIKVILMIRNRGTENATNDEVRRMNNRLQSLNDGFNDYTKMLSNDIQSYQQSLPKTKNINDNEIVRNNRNIPILNITNDKLWFANYVTLIFSTGCVFDHNHKEILDNILLQFVDRNQGRPYLDNHFKVMDYTSDLIKMLEKECGLGNGNYTMVLFVLVNVKEPEILSLAPDIKFKRYGIVAYYLNMHDITITISEYLTRFGIITESTQKYIAGPTYINQPHIVNGKFSMNRHNIDELADESDYNYTQYLKSAREHVYGGISYSQDNDLVMNKQNNLINSKATIAPNGVKIYTPNFTQTKNGYKSLYERMNEEALKMIDVSDSTDIGVYDRWFDTVIRPNIGVNPQLSTPMKPMSRNEWSESVDMSYGSFVDDFVLSRTDLPMTPLM